MSFSFKIEQALLNMHFMNTIHMHKHVFVVVLYQLFSHVARPLFSVETKQKNVYIFVKGISIIYCKMGNSQVRTEIKICMFFIEPRFIHDDKWVNEQTKCSVQNDR